MFLRYQESLSERPPDDFHTSVMLSTLYHGREDKWHRLYSARLIFELIQSFLRVPILIGIRGARFTAGGISVIVAVCIAIMILFASPFVLSEWIVLRTAQLLTEPESDDSGSYRRLIDRKAKLSVRCEMIYEGDRKDEDVDTVSNFSTLTVHYDSKFITVFDPGTETESKLKWALIRLSGYGDLVVIDQKVGVIVKFPGSSLTVESKGELNNDKKETLAVTYSTYYSERVEYVTVMTKNAERQGKVNISTWNCSGRIVTKTMSEEEFRSSVRQATCTNEDESFLQDIRRYKSGIFRASKEKTITLAVAVTLAAAFLFLFNLGSVRANVYDYLALSTVVIGFWLAFVSNLLVGRASMEGQVHHIIESKMSSYNWVYKYLLFVHGDNLSFKGDTASWAPPPDTGSQKVLPLTPDELFVLGKMVISADCEVRSWLRGLSSATYVEEGNIGRICDWKRTDWVDEEFSHYPLGKDVKIG